MKACFTFLALCLPLWLVAQQKHSINGRVLDANGKPLAGATIRIDGGAATSSLADGSFELSTEPANVKITVSHVGYLGTDVVLQLPLREPLSIRLKEDVGVLQEVTVSTGYQELPKERATGAFEHIGSELINRSTAGDIVSRLENLSPAVFFDQRSYSINGFRPSANLLVRGLSTLNSGSDPLIVLDNFPYEGDVNNINPNDVESITILKDAAAASIWGARAGNGVIVIASKKGAFNKPLSVNVTSNVTFTGKPDLYKYPQMSSSDFIDVEQFLFSKGFYTSQENNARKPALTPVVELLIARRDGKISAAELDAQLNVLRNTDQRDDFSRYMYRDALSQQYALNMSGGSPNNSYLLSAGYDHKLQNLMSNSNDRLTLRAENTLKVLKNLQVYGRVTYTGSTGERNSSLNLIGYNQIRPASKALPPYSALADADGNAFAVDKDFRSNYTSTIGNGLLLDWQYRPLDELAASQSTTSGNELLLNAGISYKPLSWLSADVKYQFERGEENTEELYSQDSYHTRNLINRFTQISGTQVTRPVPLGAIVDRSASSLNSQGLRGQLNVSHAKGLHELNGLIGAEVREGHTYGNGYRIYGYDEENLTSSNVDLVNSYPAYNNLAATGTIPSTNFQSEVTNRFISAYANAGYSYDRRYSFTLSARKDASNLFGVNTNQKGVPLGSAGFAWNISEEKFYKINWLPELKIRSSYGFSGNVDNSRSAYTTISYQNPSSINNLRFAYLVNPPDADLRWEKVGTWNIGLDFGSRGNRVSGSIDWYRKKTTDLLGFEPVDPTTGFSSANINGASTRGKGFEVMLNTRNLVGKLQWSTAVQLGHNKTVVARYLNSPTNSNAIVSGGFSPQPIEGYSVYPIFSYRFARLDGTNGDPIGYVAGVESKDYSTIVSRTPIAELVFHGSAIPLYNGTVRNTVSWKSISLSATVGFRLDYYFRRTSINYSTLVNTNSGHPDYALRWQKPGDEAITTIPSFSYPIVTNRETFYNNSEVTVQPGDNIRLYDVRLGYSFMKQQAKKTPLKNTEAFLYANNLGILWRANDAGLDPDYGSGGIPPSASIAAGLRLNF